MKMKYSNLSRILLFGIFQLAGLEKILEVKENLAQVPHFGLYPRLNRHYLPERSTLDSVFFGKQEDENNPPPAVDRLNVAFHPDSRVSEGHGLFHFLLE